MSKLIVNRELMFASINVLEEYEKELKFLMDQAAQANLDQAYESLRTQIYVIKHVLDGIYDSFEIPASTSNLGN